MTVLLTALLTTAAAQTNPAPHRPRILGLARASFYVTDPVKARAFYTDFLGFSSPYSVPQRDGEPLGVIKINDRQSVELRPGAGVSPAADRLHHVAFEVEIGRAHV